VSLDLWYHVALYTLQEGYYCKALRGYQTTTYIYLLSISNYPIDILLDYFSKTVMEHTRLLAVKYLQHVDDYCCDLCCITLNYLWHGNPLIILMSPDSIRLIA